MPTTPEKPELKDLEHRATRVWGLACAADFLRGEDDEKAAAEGFCAVMEILVEETDRLARDIGQWAFALRQAGRA